MRGTRPHNRRQLIIDAAGELFYLKGYDQVAMSDIANAVAIGPSALYRHFRGKDDLLATVIEGMLSRLDNALRGIDADDDLASVLTQTVLENRSIGVLWRREARQLTPAAQHQIRALMRRNPQLLTDALLARRPELSRREAGLLAWCAIGVATSVSFHSVSLPEAKFTDLLRQLINSALAAPTHLPSREPSAPQAHNHGQTRRETILAAATTLFAENGFGAVSIDDIGAAVGIAGPSIYHHFQTKSEILAVLLSRGNERVWMEFDRAMAAGGGPGPSLSRAIHSYQQFAMQNPQLVDILLCQSSYLPEPEKRRILSTQRGYIDEWVCVVRTQHPHWTSAEARIRVHAYHIMVNDVSLIKQLRGNTQVDCVLANIGEELLQTNGRHC